jgi:hypothetical protein
VLRIVIDDAQAVYPLSIQSVGTTAAWTVSGNENGARLGECVATAGDVNGDGFSDVIVGANFHDASAGAGADRGQAYVYLGNDSGIEINPRGRSRATRTAPSSAIPWRRRRA